MSGWTRGAAAMAVAFAGCGTAEANPFPEGFPEGWTEVGEPGTLSHDHDLSFIRVFADELAVVPYTEREQPYEPGARLLQQLYFDEQCEELVGFVVMEKLPPGADPLNADWSWRSYDADGTEVVDPRRIPDTCVTCHSWHCEEPPFGWDLTCVPGGPEPSTPFPGG